MNCHLEIAKHLMIILLKAKNPWEISQTMRLIRKMVIPIIPNERWSTFKLGEVHLLRDATLNDDLTKGLKIVSFNINGLKNNSIQNIIYECVGRDIDLL